LQGRSWPKATFLRRFRPPWRRAAAIGAEQWRTA
jgi:hypothetical protein